MLVPGHVVSLYVATCGMNGPALGSDEKEVVLLVYTIIDVTTCKVVGLQQYLVRPNGLFYQDRAGNNSECVGNNDTASPPLDLQVSPEFSVSESLLNETGKPLQNVIKAFDEYVRSLSIDPDSPTFRLVTDGQLPLRQCIHPEACAKEFDLPIYYSRFNDLRKEFVRFKSADLSRALIPIKDVKNLPNMPPVPTIPPSIEDMLKELEVPAHITGVDFNLYVHESRDMIRIILTLLDAGHKFELTESISLSLEPGICSIDEEIDGSCIVRARGLPWQSSDQDIARFFRGLNVVKGGVALCLSPQGRRNGEALVRFVSQEHRDMALRRHKHHIGNRYIEVYRATGEDFLNVAGGASNEAQAFLSKGAQVIIRMRGLPYDCTAKQVLEFFANGNDPCQVLDGNDGILFVKKPDGRPSGDAFVLFENESDAPKALSRHRELIGQRYIELFRSTTAEVQQVLNRSIDPKSYETPQPPLIAQLPPVPLLPQHIITSGTSKNCIRLRGLPFDARVEHILQFLEDFANHIIYQGVHMVYNAQGHPSGEAFIQMDSEEAARASAQLKHAKFMVIGKKMRYIEVFQCSGDDMNLVLNGGIQAGDPSKQPLLSPGMLNQPRHSISQAQTLSAGALQLSPSNQIQSTLPLPLPPPNASYLANQAQFIAQQNLLARQSAVAAATNSAAQNNQHQLLMSNYSMVPQQNQSGYQSQSISNAAAAQVQAHAAAAAAAAQHQYLFMQRPHFPMYPMGLLPSSFGHPQNYPNPYAQHNPAMAAAAAAAAAAAGGGIPQMPTMVSMATTMPMAQTMSGIPTTSFKRTFDTAFQAEQTALVDSSKRHFVRPPASLYTPYFPPI